MRRTGRRPPAFDFGPAFRWVRAGVRAAVVLLVLWLVIWLGLGGRADYVDGPPDGWVVVTGAWAGFAGLAVAGAAGLLFAQQLVLAVLERVDRGPLFPGLLASRRPRPSTDPDRVSPSKEVSKNA
ncbi:hypothetical protein [Zhihengliuella sp.]|uniref:hypothetical protein n=1 Tax=Zhihengliuella sp. TaxID=1954483 RepID=UPI002811FBC8|nr:hypothetical protein [Zhihengliuella sp.]